MSPNNNISICFGQIMRFYCYYTPKSYNTYCQYLQFLNSNYPDPLDLKKLQTNKNGKYLQFFKLKLSP